MFNTACKPHSGGDRGSIALSATDASPTRAL